MAQLFHGDCLEEMQKIDDKSVDLIFCDLPYNCTSCKWDQQVIDLDKFWIEIMRIKKLKTPIFMTCTTRFGVSLINSAPKKCPFKYDLCWKKSCPSGFLLAKKQPLRIFEMVYVFYEKPPFYDISSHKHKFLKEKPEEPIVKTGDVKEEYEGNFGKIKNPEYVKNNITRNKIRRENKKKGNTESNYDPPLPKNVLEFPEPNEEYDKREKKTRNTIKKEENYGKGYLDKKINFRKYDATLGGKGAPGNLYEPPLPKNVLEFQEPEPEPESIYSDTISHEKKYRKMGRTNGAQTYDPPLPNNMLEIKSTKGKHSTEKPVALTSWILKYYSKEGDVVLDATIGSGGMGVSCKDMNRNFIGIEKDDEIFEIACKRIN